MDDIAGRIETILLALCFLTWSYDVSASRGDPADRQRRALFPGVGSTLCGLAVLAFMIFRVKFAGKVLIDHSVVGVYLIYVGSGTLIITTWALNIQANREAAKDTVLTPPSHPSRTPLAP